MTFASTITNKTAAGAVIITTGTFDAAAVVTGNINTGQEYIYSLSFAEKGSVHGPGSGIYYDETIPGAVGSAITVHCKVNSSGIWTAIGR